MLIERAIPPDFDRGRNTAVFERARPEYDALGIRAGGFLVLPSLETTAGVTNNVFLNSTNTSSDFGFISSRGLT